MVELGGFDVPGWLCISIPLTVMLYRYLTPSVDYFKKLGIPYLKPWPVLGNNLSLMIQGPIDHDSDLRKRGKVVGYSDGSTPALIIYDLDMLKEILVKHFKHFQNRRSNELPGYPERKLMTEINFDHWKHVRSLLTPTFSGGKLRRMTDTVNMCSRNLLSHLGKMSERGEVVELKREAGNFTLDVIAGTAFGLDINTSEDGENDFVKNGLKIYASISGFSMRMFIFLVAPRLMRLFKLTLFPKDTMDFFFEVINQALKNRGDDELKAKDFLQLMINAQVDDPKEAELGINEDLVRTKEGFIYSKKGLTHEEILAQAFIFFLAGYDTTASQLSFLCYNLACYPEAQEKLYQEIVEVMGDLEEPDYDVIKKMPYLEMCIEETGRLYPAIPRADRQCNEDIVINGLEIKKDTMIFIPIWCIHHDPEIYPEPYQFVPERFSADEKAGRHSMASMPFGQGPRNCIGMRFALMEIKFAIIHILLKFKIVTCSETGMPDKLKLEKYLVSPVNGLKVKLEPRN